jgi:hypothetical protein
MYTDDYILFCISLLGWLARSRATLIYFVRFGPCALEPILYSIALTIVHLGVTPILSLHSIKAVNTELGVCNSITMLCSYFIISECGIKEVKCSLRATRRITQS